MISPQQRLETNWYILAGFFFIVLCFSYSNHFNNAFQFDDHHTITQNKSIRSLSNIPSFFIDAGTGTVKTGLNYRPIVATLNAIDYSIAGKGNTFPFHVHIFLSFILLLVLLYVMFRNILQKVLNHQWIPYIALFATAYFGLHTSNAETINYIIARSDSFSTLCMVAGIVLYQYPKTRKFQLHLLAMIIGMLTKQTGIVFPFLLWTYIILFELEIDFTNLNLKEERKKFLDSIIKVLPALAIGLSLFAFNQLVMTEIAGYNTGRSKFWYLMTQSYVLTSYLFNFILPIELVVETDISMIRSFADPRLLIGMGANICLAGIGIWALFNKKYYPITFGILWFYFALAPTSSILPRFQIANHHRMFFPFIGLAFAVSWAIGYFMIQNESKLKTNSTLKNGLLIFFAFILCSYAFGTYQRNKAWKSGETLWMDALTKSPRSGRVLKFCGDIQTRKGNIDSALVYYQRSEEFWTKNPDLQLRLAKSKSALDETKYLKDIEMHYEKAIKRGRIEPKSYIQYAKWLKSQDRLLKAKKVLTKGLKLNAKNESRKAIKTRMQNLLDQIKIDLSKSSKTYVDSLTTIITESPTDLTNTYKLANHFYKVEEYQKCLNLVNKCIKNNKQAKYYNLKCIALNQLKNWDKAILACEKAIQLGPNNKIFKNNLNWAVKGKEKESKNPADK